MKTTHLRLPLLAIALLLAGLQPFSPPALSQILRPPAVPLVACDPYFSIWSAADKLTDVDTTHWSDVHNLPDKPDARRFNRILSQVSIDGKVFRVLGTQPSSAPALPQKSVAILPTRTICVFDNAAAGAAPTVRLTLTFLTPALPDDVDILSRPVTYITYAFESLDAKPHAAAIQFTAAGDITVSDAAQQTVTGSTPKVPGLATLSLGAKDQRVLGRSGDRVGIDWGYLYLAADSTLATGALSTGLDYQNSFGTPNAATAKTGINGAVPASQACATLRFAPFTINAAAPATRTIILAYDDLYSIQYFGKNLRPYWRRNGWEAADLLTHSAADYESLRQRCETFDTQLLTDLAAAGGKNYADLCSLAYRQCFAAGKFVADANGQPLQFCKENTSNGCIGTSDVFYPMSPLFLLNGPTLAKSFIVPFMNYAASKRWPFPFAPHDLGQYPIANGQVYGGREQGLNNQMPVEESGNLLILFAAIAHMEGNANFADLYWPTLEKWADYLKQKGYDPENQLCTDDFAGHLAHNTNLSIKAIMGLGSFAKLCDMRGDKTKAAEYRALAQNFAQRWVKEADDGDHYRLAFDKPGTWSQKYNLVWDRILDLNLFPREVARKEMDFYLKTQNPHGLPLDNRKTYTKTDWTTWTATLTQNRADFDALIAPMIKFYNTSPQRVPMSDWYFTDTAEVKGFIARPVVGGVFIQMLHDKAAWSKYAALDQTKAANWAPLPPGYMTAAPMKAPKAAKKKK